MVTIKNKEYGSNISLAAICNSLCKAEHQLLEEFVTVGAIRGTQYAKLPINSRSSVLC